MGVGVGAGLYMYVVVVQKFTFAISSPDEFLFVFLRVFVENQPVLSTIPTRVKASLPKF